LEPFGAEAAARAVVGRGRDGEEEDGDDDYEMTEHEVVLFEMGE